MNRPTHVIWDVTYACPLRCVHCYSESGRRPARRLAHGDLFRLADAIIAMGPRSVEFAGGEPLVVKGIHEVAEHIGKAGIEVGLYTGAWTLTPEDAEESARVFDRVTVSLDGADAEVHDRVRGRRGSFDRVLNALALFDAVPGLEYGIDCSVMRANFHQLPGLCADLAPRFPRMSFLNLAAAVPAGLASRPGFAESELLSNAELATLTSQEYTERLRSLAPPSLRVTTSDNWFLMMHPRTVARHGFPLMQIEPDGEVRAMPVYEGCVGNLLTDDPDAIWRRAVERWSDPFVVETLSPVRSMADWAEAARRIDRRFGSPEVIARIERRPAWPLAARPA
ncbi:radical SAM protein [Actinomadura sp. ATCC 31491]|uniref:Radical SAM protein n=1 Tax=Actinomadura luzonensis TaxID=2805427 RepID=A0ABT0FN45_9ACTN|nr:radical SAM protein [Actinomadura luzonensis]MCK2213722.1 radical SAM protein [Actinomadura luzonensis]